MFLDITLINIAFSPDCPKVTLNFISNFKMCYKVSILVDKSMFIPQYLELELYGQYMSF